MGLHPAERERYFPDKTPAELDPIQRALQENEDWYRDLVEHSQDLLCIHDLQGRLLSVNPSTGARPWLQCRRVASNSHAGDHRSRIPLPVGCIPEPAPG